MQSSTTTVTCEAADETDEDLLSRFEEHRLNLGLSPRGIRQYLKTVRNFIGFLKERKGQDDHHLANATQRDVDAWTSTMRKAGNKQNTRRINLCALKAVAKYGNLAIRDIAVPGRDLSGTEDLKRNVLDADEYQVLSDTVTEAYRRHRALDNPHGVRGALTVMLCMETALRVGEIRSLDVDDIYPDPLHNRPMLSIHGKGARQRTMRISDGLYIALRDYVDNLRDPEVATGALLVSRQGIRCPDRTLRTTFHSYTTRFVHRRMGPHQIRRSTVTAWHRAGHSPEVIRQWAGHRDVATTFQCYISATPKDLEAAEEARLNGTSVMGPGSNGGGPDSSLQEKLNGIESAKKAGLLTDEDAKERVDRLLGLDME